MDLDKDGKIIIGNISHFKTWLYLMTRRNDVLKDGNGVNLETCHFLHLLQALRIINERVKQIPIDPDVLKDIRSFIYGRLQPWVDEGTVSKVKASDGSFIYSCKLNYPGLIEVNTWEEYELSIFDALPKEEKPPALSDEERAAIEASLLTQIFAKSNGRSKNPPKEETEASEASKTRRANARRDKKKKDAEEFAKKAAIRQEEIRISNLNKQKNILKAIRANKIKCADEALAKKGGAAVPMGGGGGGSTEEKEDE
jgi:hypothetical protein